MIKKASAIVATAPGINAKDEEVTYAVANITVFGIAVSSELMAMLSIVTDLATCASAWPTSRPNTNTTRGW
jgi:uncharacterized membrane protein YadS